MIISSSNAYPPAAPPPGISRLPSTDAEVVAENRTISNVVRLLNDTLTGPPHEFSIAIDPTTRQAVVSIVDLATREIIDQVPKEYLLRIARQLSEESLNSGSHPSIRL